MGSMLVCYIQLRSLGDSLVDLRVRLYYESEFYSSYWNADDFILFNSYFPLLVFYF